MKRQLTLIAALLLASLAAVAQNNSNAQGLMTAAGSACLTTNSNCVLLPLPSGSASAAVTLSGTFSATVQFEVSADGANFVAANAAPQPSGALVASATSTGTWSLPVAGMMFLRARTSAYTSGTVSAFLQSSSASSAAVGSQTGGSGGSMFIGNSGSGSVGDGLTLLSSPNSTSNALIMAPIEFNGVSWDRVFYCPNTTPFSVASTTTQVVALSGSTKIRICSASLNPSTITAGNVDIVYGTGSSCATGITTLTGAFTLPASAVVNIPIPLTAQGPLIAPAGNAVCVRTTTATVAGFITWAQF